MTYEGRGVIGITTEGRLEAITLDDRPGTSWGRRFVSFSGRTYVHAVGGERGCAWTADFESVCWSLAWGSPALIQPDRPTRDFSWFLCWLPADGDVSDECRSFERADAPGREEVFARFDGEMFSTCALRRDGTVFRPRVAGDPPAERFGQIRCNEYGAGCGVTFAGELSCWSARDSSIPLPAGDPFAP
ncbi:MAG: hypothetical protein M3Y87_04705 [Myxococcota bacterium]|nr:hypothetical protein [Myxococcota bacterium]